MNLSASISARRFAMPERFYLLDAARGIAALAVVFHHWIHFFPGDPASQESVAATRPYFSQFSYVYLYGNIAVDFFFALSGFIFYWLYSERIAGGKVSAGEFASYRLSRLYPLHLATLLVVLAMQRAYLAGHESFFVYKANDLRHFVANLLFATSWGLTPEWSFNGPSWSISVEVLLYVVFFASCRMRATSWWQLVLFAALGRFLMTTPLNLVGRGMITFFLGGVTFLLYLRSVRGSRIQVATGLALLVATAGWALSVVEIRSGFLGEAIPPRWLRLAFLAIVIPSTVLSLVLVETVRGAFARPLAFLGDVSYSTYLLHFPLQLAFVLVTDALGFGRDVYHRPATLLLFFAALIPLSLASYHGFEAPMQARLRRLSRAGTKASAPVRVEARPSAISLEEIA